MLKTLASVSFLEEIKQFNTKRFPEEYKNLSLPINYPWHFGSEKNKEELNLQNYLKECSKKLSHDEVEFYVIPFSNFSNIEFLAVSSEFIIEITHDQFNVLDTSCNYLYSFGQILDSPFTIEDKNFNFSKSFNSEKMGLTLLYNNYDKNYMRAIEFTNKKNNTISISSPALSLTSVRFEENEITATFKGTFYSRLILDYNFNLKFLELNKSLKTEFGINNVLNFDNVKNHSDLIKSFETTFKDQIEIFTLINDSKLKIKGSEQKFNRDLAYIKALTERKDSIFNIFSSEHTDLKEFYTYYKNYSGIIREYLSEHNTNEDKINYLNNHPIFSKYEKIFGIDKNKNLIRTRYHNILEFLYQNKESNNKFINNNMLRSYERISKECESILDFNKDLILLKKNNKTKLGN